MDRMPKMKMISAKKLRGKKNIKHNDQLMVPTNEGIFSVERNPNDREYPFKICAFKIGWKKPKCISVTSKPAVDVMIGRWKGWK
jgi:hypothetical protein